MLLLFLSSGTPSSWMTGLLSLVDESYLCWLLDLGRPLVVFACLCVVLLCAAVACCSLAFVLCFVVLFHLGARSIFFLFICAAFSISFLYVLGLIQCVCIHTKVLSRSISSFTPHRWYTEHLDTAIFSTASNT